MKSLRYVHWKEDDYYLGCFENYPDYLTQEKSEEKLMENLVDLYKDMISAEIAYFPRSPRLDNGKAAYVWFTYEKEADHHC